MPSFDSEFCHRRMGVALKLYIIYLGIRGSGTFTHRNDQWNLDIGTPMGQGKGDRNSEAAPILNVWTEPSREYYDFNSTAY